MMESKVRTERLVGGARRRRVRLGACPYCGGDVRLVRDIYGAYRQCLQCSREIQPGTLPAAPAIPTGMPAMPQVEELMAA